ncbi:hypothetical protein KOR42_24400 [Thalassoglobus neptunius]|uniref:Uncharacterized protein n=1 Tax=Thalassoglobus neptunius TaxID=1938619 RepID=A0A5C5X9I3_9PLAN|nr:hypothetical protein [Thalassoglobus neptunius]TWT59051.1 hypothetical protein KOR42_24400 [Thalassoglobus neptunius]
MRRRIAKSVILCGFGLVAVLAISKSCPAASDQVYSSPSAEQLQLGVNEWLTQRGLERSPAVDAVQPFWEFSGTPSPEQKFDALMRTFYLADDQTRKIVDQCQSFSYGPELLRLQAVPSEMAAAEPLYSHNVNYFLARHLALLTAYSEAVELFKTIDLNYVVDPAGCLFYRSVCEHHLLLRNEGLDSLDKLLESTESVPVRYQELGELMRNDLQSVKEKSLGEVARQMRDVERRLNLGRTGYGVQEVEERIIATLDELIKKMEQQQQQQSQSSAGSSNSSAPENGADDTYLGGIQGEGLTDKKDIGNKDNWGDLPPKAREAARNMLDRQFPSHYRQAVEQYLKKLADRPAPSP